MAYSGALGSVVQYLLQLLDKEVDLLVGVKDEVGSLKGQLGQINIFLDTSEGRQNDEAGKEVVRQIREVAYNIEDVIDRYILIYSQFMRRNAAVKTVSIDYTLRLSRVGKKIERLQKKIENILHNRKNWRVLGTERAEASVGPAAREEAVLHRRRRDVEVEDVVGFIDDSAKLVSRLTTGNLELDVISIIGIGGLGKTTLAKKIYNDASVQRHFKYCRAWVCVSQDFRVKELLLEILTSHLPIWERDELTKKIEGMSNNELQNKYLKEQLVKHLKGKRYLVVMDDIWSTEVWDQLQRAFPENGNGSRILITSRIKAVASHASCSSDPYFLPLLNQDESWNLLSKKVFGRRGCPPELETPGRQMAECCRGLPLSIVELAGILANKEKSLMNWSRSVGKVNWYLNESDCKKILALSYTHLPRQLKLCFLYLGVYPKDYEIPVRQLIQLWIAEGFIPPAYGGEIEDKAEDDYLEEFIDQNLIQVVSRRTDGGKKTCVVPDLLLDICISQCKEEMFLEVFKDTKLSFPKSRRLSLQGKTPGCISSKCARSLLFFGPDTYSSGSNHLKWAIQHLELVRVLNFEEVKLYSIPTKIEKLVFLRYLRIKSLELKDLPPSIYNLENLETLDMRGTFLTRLPNGIWKMRRLRNLYMYGPMSLPDHLDQDITAMGDLRVLSTVSPNQEIVRRISSGEIFNNLTKFGIWFASSEKRSELVEVIKCLHYLSRLRTLKIVNCSEYLILSSSIFPVTITKITLRQVRLKVRPDMKVLGKLPNLQILKLRSCMLSRKLHIFPGSFLKLQVLKLENLRIKTWKQRRGAMPYLKHLVIKECFWLTVLPQELRLTTSLLDVEVLGCNTNLVTMLQDMQTNLGFNLRTD